MRPPETRHSLIVRLKDQRNDLAWTEFVCAYEPFLMRLVRNQGTPDRHAADVTQQLLMTIAKSVGGWKPDGKVASFRRWLGCVARNVVIRFMTRERKQITGQGGSEFLVLLEEFNDTSIDAEQARQYEQELILWAAELVRGEFRQNSWRTFWETEIEGRSVAEVSRQLPAWFDMIVHKLLAKQPEDRFGSAAEVAAFLEGCLAHLQQPAMVPLPESCRVAKRRRGRLTWPLVAVTVTTVVLLSGNAFLSSLKPRQTASDNSAPAAVQASPNSLDGGRESVETIPAASQLVDWNGGEEALSPVRNDLDEWSEHAKQLWPPTFPVPREVQ
ncbi:MAG TPA: hypothetical protein EYG03_31090 [Planctomycetes bacterium]|nr:hypothetical protein [Fuerstiella sp.]HIK96410.1 hypothetical protein [Planctomycetota bacterium]